MKILFIGGTGTISTACTALAAQRGYDVHLLNRGQRKATIPPGVTVRQADIRQPDTVRAALGDQTFDVVVDFIAFNPQHIETDLQLFRGCGQFIFISSASAYQKPLLHYRITESTPLGNPYWEYSRNKIACEERLMRAWREDGFPVTIVRPSHTYNERSLPTSIGGGDYTLIARMRAGKPVIVHGDGESLWVLTHHTDFAKAFVGLLGHRQSIGHAFHITSDEVQSWNLIYRQIAEAAGAADKLNIVHLPSDWLALHDPNRRGSLIGDKAASVVFDNTKIKQFVPDYVATTRFAEGVRQIVAWFDADPARRTINEKQDAETDRLIEAWRKALP